MNDPMNDAEFEAYIARRSRLSRQYQDLSADIPPKELDEAVLGRARSALALDRKETPEREVYIRWMAPVAFAATVVLVFTVVLQIVIRPAGEPMPLADEAAAPVAAASPAAAAPDQAPQPEIDNRQNAKLEASLPAAKRSRADAPAAPPAPPVREQELDRAEGYKEKKSDGLQTGALAKDAAKSRAVERTVEANESAGIVTVTGSRQSSDALVTAPGMPRPILEEERRDPEVWLAAIEKLRKDGHAAAADAEMKLFLEKYPDYFRTHPLPEGTH